jgi:hypothetical protein
MELSRRGCGDLRAGVEFLLPLFGNHLRVVRSRGWCMMRQANGPDVFVQFSSEMVE